MVMTANMVNAQRAKQRATGAKPEDLARKFMSKADVLKEKAEKKEKEAFLAQQAAEYDKKKSGKSDEAPVIKSTKEILSEEKQKKIDKLLKEKESMKGPGSVARKEAIDKAIADLEGKE